MEKKKWSKPECQRVKLVVEESVITGCKHGHDSGPGTICAGGISCRVGVS
jgi:hypothetical protein